MEVDRIAQYHLQKIPPLIWWVRWRSLCNLQEHLRFLASLKSSQESHFYRMSWSSLWLLNLRQFVWLSRTVENLLHIRKPSKSVVKISSVGRTCARTQIAQLRGSHLVCTRICNYVYHSLQRGTDGCIFDYIRWRLGLCRSYLRSPSYWRSCTVGALCRRFPLLVWPTLRERLDSSNWNRH